MFATQDLLEETDGLRKFALKLTRNVYDAEDLVQSTVLRALEKRTMFQSGTNLFSWTSKIMYNMFVSNYRRKTKYESQYDPEPYINNQSQEASQDIKMEVQDIENAMQELNEEHQEVLMMVCVKNMKYAEVSEALQIPVGTVRSRLSRAREALKTALSTPREAVLKFSARHNDFSQQSLSRAA